MPLPHALGVLKAHIKRSWLHAWPDCIPHQGCVDRWHPHAPQQYWSPSTAHSLCLAHFNAKRRAQQPYREHVTVLWRLCCLSKPRQLSKCSQAAACASINLG